MSGDYQPIDSSKNFRVAPLALALLAVGLHIFFKPRHSKFAIVHENLLFGPSIST